MIKIEISVEAFEAITIDAEYVRGCRFFSPSIAFWLRNCTVTITCDDGTSATVTTYF